MEETLWIDGDGLLSWLTDTALVSWLIPAGVTYEDAAVEMGRMWSESDVRSEVESASIQLSVKQFDLAAGLGSIFARLDDGSGTGSDFLG